MLICAFVLAYAKSWFSHDAAHLTLSSSRYAAPDQTSGMSVVEVNMVSGWIADVSSLQSLINSSDVQLKRYEMNWKQPDHVNFYFDQVITV